MATATIDAPGVRPAGAEASIAVPTDAVQPFRDPTQLALVAPVVVATRLGFDVSKADWRVGFWRFVRRCRLPYVRLSARRLRFRPDLDERFIQSREHGRLEKPRPFSALAARGGHLA